MARGRTGQHGLPNAAATHSMFGAATAAAFHGKADSNKDHRIDVGELFGFLETRLAKESTAEARQTPHLFVPDATPARLTNEAKLAINETLSYLRGRYHVEVEQQSVVAQSLAPNEPEPLLALGLVQLKHDRTLGATKTFNRVRSQFPDSLIADLALAWLSFRRGEPRDGIELLEQLVLRIPETRNAAEQAYAEHILDISGRLVCYSMRAAPAGKQLTLADRAGLNKAVLRSDDVLVERYILGFKSVSSAFDDLTKQVSTTTDPNEKATMQRDLTRLTFYIESFDFGVAQQLLRANLEH